MKKIAIITGATGKIGEEFVKRLISKNELEEIWVSGRNDRKLTALKDAFGDRIIPFQCDLSDKNELDRFIEQIAQSDVEIRYLVNNAGLAKMGRYDDFSKDEIENTIDVNCKAVALLCQTCIPKMTARCRILNISSAASFQPNPYIALYSATKVFVKNYSRALNYELAKTKITCTAVCPGWVDTEMLKKESDGKAIRFPGMVSAERVVKKAIKDADKGKALSVCSLFVKYEHFLSKIMPNRLIMKIWAKAVEKYL